MSVLTDKKGEMQACFCNLLVNRESLGTGRMACLGQGFELLRDKSLSNKTTLVSRDISDSEVETNILLQSLDA